MSWLHWLKLRATRTNPARKARRNSHFGQLVLEALEDRLAPSAGAWLAVGANVNVSKSLGTQAESTLAINPTNPANLFMTDSQSDVCRYSTDGGATWTVSDTSALSSVKIYSNPAVAWDSFGNLFLVYQTQTNNVIVARSSNGGATLKAPQTVISNADQPSIAVGPGGSAAAGSVWVSASPFASDDYTAAGAPVSGLDSVGSFITPQAAPGAAGHGGFGGIAIGPSGQVLVSYQNDTSGSGPDTIHTDLDPDGLGAQGFNTVVNATSTNVGGFTYTVPAQATQGISANLGVAWDRSGGAHNGRVYLVYTDRPSTSSADTDIYVRSSDNNGSTWSSAVRVNDDTAGNGKSQFMPALAVDQTTGNVAVTWYDTRNSGSNNKTVQLFGSASLDGGATWLSNVQISASASNSTTDPSGFNFGNYDTMDFSNGVLYRSWADNSNITWDNPNGAANGMNVYTAKVSLVSGPALATAVHVGANVNITPENNGGSLAETSIAINPTNPQNLLETSTAGNAPKYSLDGGIHWIDSNTSSLPHFHTDIAGAFDSFGNAFITWVGAANFSPAYVAWSYDGGASFPPSQYAAMQNSAGSDQPAITTGPSGIAGEASVWVSFSTGRYLHTVVDAWVTNPGAGYTSAPTVSFSGGGGSGAAATATIANGQVTNITITSPGTGYTANPTLTLAGGGGSGATATALVNEIMAAGAPVYGPNNVGAFNAPKRMPGLGAGGNFGSIAVGPTGRVAVNYQNDMDYQNTPQAGPDAIWLDYSSNGLGAAGFTAPTAPNGGLTSIIVNAGGSGYTSAPSVSFDSTGTGGNGVTGTAVIDTSTGTVTNVIITNPGSGYLLAPTVTIHNGGSGVAAATATAVVGTVTRTNAGPYTALPAIPGRDTDAEGNLAWDRSGGPHNGRLYLAYNDRRTTASVNVDVFLRYSDDNGASWSSPVRVNDITTNGSHNTTSASHFQPAIAVDQTTGYVAVTWYDTRNDPNSILTEIYGTISVDGGVTWLPNLQIASGASDATTSGAGTFRYGDFDIMDFYRDTFYRSWADNSNSTGDNLNGVHSGLDLYTAPVSIPTTGFFLSAPSIATAGTAFNFTVTALDAFGNTDTGYSGTVHFTSSDGSAALQGNATLVNGVGTFSATLKTTAAQTLTATDTVSGALTATAAVAVSPGAADHLKFIVQPSNGTAGSALSPTVKVQVLDHYNNLETGDNSDQVTLAVATGPGGFAGGSTTTATVSGGGASFSNLVVNVAGSYTLGDTATGGLTGPNSSSFTISPASADHLGFSVQPGTTTTGAAISPAVKVKVFDQYGNLLAADNSDQVTLALASGPGGLTGGSTTTATVSGGIASFNNLVLDTAGSYTLGETATGGLSGPASGSFTINPAAANNVAFSAQPGTTTAGSAISPAVKVKVFDQYGNLLTADNSDQVTVAVAGGPGGFASGSTTIATASAGVASFSNLVLKTAGSYTLSATATGGLSGPASGSFTVNPASADHLGFSVTPSNSVAGAAITPAVKVKVFDQYGNLLTGDNSDQVTIALASGPGGVAGGSTTTATVSGGVASFSNLVLDTAGSYTLGETATGGLSGPASSSFTVSPASADHLGFSVQPGTTTAGAAISPAVKVKVFDPYGNLLAGDNSDQVTLSAAGPGSFTGGSTTTATVSGGIASFSNLVLDTAGSYTLGATATGGLSGPGSSGFTVNPASANHLGFSVQPTNTTTGNAINPAVQVKIFDQYGNLLAADNSDQVTLTATGPGGIASGSTVTASGGLATFGNLVLDTAGNYTLAATATGGLSGPNSGSFTISAGNADHLAFSGAPGNGVAGAAISPAVQVKVFDQYGNLVAADNSDQVTLAVASGPGGIASGSTATASGGIATFSNLVLNTAGSYTLGATATGGLSGPASSGFTVGAASADHLGFSVQPGSATAGAALSPAVKVKVFDQYGNPLIADNSDQVTLAVASGPGGFTGGSTTAATVSGGIASFSNLVLDAAGSYTLGATASGGLTGPNSGSFTVTAAAADHLGFSVQPASTMAGNAISPAVQVRVFDPYGNLLAGDNSDQVTLSAAGPGGFASGSTTMATVSGGVASFSNLVLKTAGSYTLGDTATGSLSGPSSAGFTVSAATADHLGFSVAPSNTVAGAAISPAVQVNVLDPYGNLLASDNSDQVTLAASGPGGFAGGSSTTVTVSAGKATFSNLVVDTAGNYTLGEAATGGLSGPNSGSFTISAAAADHLGFSVQPGSATAGSAISPAVKVKVFDPYGNLLAADNSDQVTLAVASGPAGFAGGSTTTATVSGGVASFSNLVLNTTGTYTLGETATGGLSGPSSASFAVNPAAADHLGFSVQPTNATAGAALSPAVKVKVFDQYGNLLAGDNSDQVTLAVASGPAGFAGGSTTTATVSAGVASFSNLVLDTAGSYTLGETATGGLSGPNSSSFTISAATADHLGFSVQPATATAGVALSPAVKVKVLDQYGNLVAADTSDQVTLAVGSGPAGFAGGSTTTATVSSGVATFSNLVLDTAGSYTLGATATGGLSGPNSSSFTVTAAAADHLGFSVQPASTTAGNAISPAVQVKVFDLYGNFVTADNSDQVTLTATGPGGFAGGSTTTATVSSGVASFSNLVLDNAGSYTLGATATGGLAGPPSSTFAVNPALADHVGFSVQPSDATAGSALSPTVKVKVFDQYGNLLTADNSDQVTLAVASGLGAFAGGSTTTATVSGGVASFSNLVLNTAGSYTLGATATGGLGGPGSASFTINPAAADHLGFSVPPSDSETGFAISPAVQVKVFDRYGNRLVGDNTDQVTLSVASGPGGFTGGSTTTLTVSGGSATFTNLVLATAGSYTLGAATAGGVTGPSSGAFTVSAPVAARLSFGVQPADVTAGSAIAPAVQVQIIDQFGHLFTGDNTDQVTLALATGPGSFAAGSATTETVSGGIATFDNLVLDTAGSYSLGATATGGLSGPSSHSFTVNPAAANNVSFSVQPGTTTAGLAIGPAVRVKVFDQYGNLLAADNSDHVTLAVASGPGGFAGGSTTSATVNGGVASFSNLVLDTAGTYTLAATATGGLSGPSSASFTVTAASADHLGFSVQPSLTTAGAAIRPAVQVKVLDPYGNLVAADNSDQVTLAVASGPGGFTGGSTAMATVSSGVAALNNLVLDTAGSYTLAVTATGGLSGPSSSSFTVSAASADHLRFSVQPSTTTAGVAIGPAVQVQVLDQYGNLLTGDNGDQVTLSATGPGGFTGSTTTATVSAGSASFGNLVLDTAGGYTLGATATGGVSGPNSSSFVVNAAAADHLSFSVQPSQATAGLALSPAVQVQVLDQFGNLLTGDNHEQVTLTVAGGPGGFAGGSTTLATVSAGSATFSNLVLDVAGSYVLAATATGGLSGPNSSSFTVSPASADHLGFSGQPGTTTAGAALNPAVKVKVFDQYGNQLTGDNSDQVTLSVTGPGGFAGGSTTSATVSGGVASFSKLVLDAAGSYTLGATASGGLSGPSSAGFTVTAAGPDHLGFAAAPADTTAGSAIAPAVAVEVLDAYGNTVTTDNTDQLTVTVASGPGGFAAGSTTNAAVRGGLARFSNLLLDIAGSYTLSASATGGLRGPSSGSFAINAAAADHVGFSTPPSNTTAGSAINPAVQVALFDQFGNVVTSDNHDPVTVRVASGPGSFAGGSGTTAIVSAGVASFGNLKLDTAGAYTLIATAGSDLTGPASAAFTVVPAAADHLAFGVQPSDTTAGTAISPAVTVQVLDPYGNLLAGDNTDQVTLAVAGPGSFAAGSRTAMTVSAGVATFDKLVLDTAGSYTLTPAATGGRSGPASGGFTVRPASTTDHLVFSVPPSDGVAGVAISPAVQVELFDRFGNLRSDDSSDTVSLTTASGPGTLTGSSTIAAPVHGGVAVFGNLVLDTAGSYTLAASATGTSVSLASPSFTVAATGADHLGFGVQPSDAVAGKAIAPAVTVQVVDRYGNIVTGDNTDQVSITSVGPAGNQLLGSAAVTGGIATFANLVIDQSGIGYTLVGSSNGRSTPPSSRFNILASAATQLVVTAPPVGPLTANAGFNVQLAAEDDFYNIDPLFTSTIQVGLTSNSVAGSLSGPQTAAPQAGVVGFNGLAVSLGGPYGLSFTAGSLRAARLNLTALAFQRTLAAVAQDNLNPAGTPVTALLLKNYVDHDANTKPGIAVTQASGNGAWQYSSGGGWLGIGSVSPAQALLLPASDQVRFVPALHWSGPASLLFTAWDGSQGTAGGLASTTSAGGTTPFSLASAQANLTVLPGNDVPIWTAASANLTPLLPGATNPYGDTVASIFGAAFGGGSGVTVGVAVTSVPATRQGVWSYSRDGGASWTPLGTPTPGAARLLSGTDRIRFVPATNLPALVTLQAYAWNPAATGTDGATANVKATGKAAVPHAFSATPLTVDYAVNDAPVLSSAQGPLLPATRQDVVSAAIAVRSLLATASDADAHALQGVAITGAAGPGAWQYALSGAGWQTLPVVSEAVALLLPTTAQLRFLPALHQSGQATISYRAWDQTAGVLGGLNAVNGTGGAFAFSLTEATATLAITAVPPAPQLTAVATGAINPSGDRVDAIFGAFLSATLPGIAVTGLTGATNGAWQYSLDGGANWSPFKTVAASAARLLAANDLIRFVPRGSFAGTVSLQAVAWNGTTGQAGDSASVVGKNRSAFATLALTATCLVNAAPALTS